MSDYLISAVTALHPTTAQAVQLSALFDDANAVHFAVRGWLRAVGTGSPISLHEAFTRTSLHQPIPVVGNDCPLDLRPEHVALLGSVRSTDLPLRWRGTVPDTVLDTLLRIEVSRLSRFGDRSIARVAVPLRPLTRVPLDTTAQPLDRHHVTLEGIHHPLIADLWALPSDLTLALLYQAQEDHKTLEQRWTDLTSRLHFGQPFKAAEALQLGMQTGAYRGSSPVQRVGPSRPPQARHVSLIQGTDVTGNPIWQLAWTVRVPQGYLPTASIDDTVGIDFGYRRLATAASGQNSWFVERRTDVREGLPNPCQDDPLQLLAHARARHLLLELHRTGIETFVLQVLQYRRVHVEQTNWSGFQIRGNAPWSAVAMDLIGTPRIAEWIQLFAPVTRSEVKLIDPAKTSQTCHRCGGSGLRPRPYREFQCSACGPFDADVNSAYVIRHG